MCAETSSIDRSTLGLHSIEQYEPFVGTASVERIIAKACKIGASKIEHVSSTFYGSGVTEFLTPLTLMMNASGIETDWHLIQGMLGFFSCTKKLHNSMRGATVEFSETDQAVHEEVVFQNATRLHPEDCDTVIVHDPQPLPLICENFLMRRLRAEWLDLLGACRRAAPRSPVGD